MFRGNGQIAPVAYPTRVKAAKGNNRGEGRSIIVEERSRDCPVSKRGKSVVPGVRSDFARVKFDVNNPTTEQSNRLIFNICVFQTNCKIPIQIFVDLCFRVHCASAAFYSLSSRESLPLVINTARG